MTNQSKTIPHLHIKLAGTGFGIQMHKKAFLEGALQGARDLWSGLSDAERTALAIGGLGATGAGIGGLFGGWRGALAGALGGAGVGAAVRRNHLRELLDAYRAQTPKSRIYLKAGDPRPSISTGPAVAFTTENVETPFTHHRAKPVSVADSGLSGESEKEKPETNGSE